MTKPSHSGWATSKEQGLGGPALESTQPTDTRPAHDPLSPEQARTLTDAIRADLGSLAANLATAYRGRVWEVLGYETWADYTAAEFSPQRWMLPAGEDRQAVLETLTEAGMSQREMAAATGLSQPTISRALNPSPEVIHDESPHGDVWSNPDGWRVIVQRAQDGYRVPVVTIPRTWEDNAREFVSLCRIECASLANVLAIYTAHPEVVTEAKKEEALLALLESFQAIEHWTVVQDWVKSLDDAWLAEVVQWWITSQTGEDWPLADRLERAQAVLAGGAA